MHGSSCKAVHVHRAFSAAAGKSIQIMFVNAQVQARSPQRMTLEWSRVAWWRCGENEAWSRL